MTTINEKNKKQCLKRTLYILSFDLVLLLFYLLLKKLYSLVPIIKFAIFIVALIGTILFNIYMSIITIFIAKGYSDEKLEQIYKKWYMKMIKSILTVLMIIEIVLIILE